VTNAFLAQISIYFNDEFNNYVNTWFIAFSNALLICHCSFWILKQKEMINTCFS